MIDPGILLLAAILLGTPTALILWCRWIDSRADRDADMYRPHEHGLPATIMEDLDAEYLRGAEE